MKIEIFVHGALCMAVSGKCYLSLHSNYASANRGACIQNCRKSYVVIDKEDGVEFEIDNEYIMSAKDLCTIEFLDKVIDAVIASDHAVFNYAKKTGMKVHISTQANVSNIDSIEFFSAYSDVMVMARELSLMQVASITKEIKRRNITGP